MDVAIQWAKDNQFRVIVAKVARNNARALKVDREYGFVPSKAAPSNYPLLLATAARHGCEIVLSEDMQDGARFGRLIVLDPFFGEALPKRVAELLL